MFRVWIPILGKWIENIPATEAVVYLEEGYKVIRMDLPYETPPR